MMRRLVNDLRLVLVVSRDVYRSALKERMMYGFLLLALLFILMANVPFMVDDPKIFQGEPPAVAAVQIGFVSLNIFTILIGVFVSLSTLQNFLAKERLALLLVKPVKYWHILEGVILGLFEMIFMNWVLMTAGIWFIVVSQTKVLEFSIWIGMSVTVLLGLLYVTLVVFFYVLMPNAMAGLLTILAVIAGFGAPLARQAFASASYPGFFKTALQLGLYALPPINTLWGLSMKELRLFDLKISPLPVLLQTGMLIVFLNLAGVWRLPRLKKIIFE